MRARRTHEASSGWRRRALKRCSTRWCSMVCFQAKPQPHGVPQQVNASQTLVLTNLSCLKIFSIRDFGYLRNLLRYYGLPLSISIQQQSTSFYFHQTMRSLSQHRSAFQSASLFLLPQPLPRSFQSGWRGISCATGWHGVLVQDSPAQ